MLHSRRIRAALRLLLRKAGGAARNAGRVLARAEAALADPSMLASEQRHRIRSAMTAHDMVADPDEGYYRDRYWSWIESELAERGVDLSGTILDAGCGSGRLTLPLARRMGPHGGRMVGVDMLQESIDAAERQAGAEGLGNVSFRRGELLAFLAGQPSETFTAALFLEVAFVVLDLPAHIEQLRRVLVPGGLLLASFRTQYYLALLGAARRDWDLTREVLRSRSGRLSDMGWQNWHSARDVEEMLGASGFSDARLAGLGLFSGIAGDPLAAVARPSTLSAADREGLSELESGLAAHYPDTGRYLLASAVRTR